MNFFDRQLETASRDALEADQLEKLRHMLSVLYGRNRFCTARMKEVGFHPRDFRSLADLAGLPLTRKDDLMAAQESAPPPGLNATFDERAYVRVHQTSGTTGPPLRVYDTAESWEWWGRCWAFVLAGAGLGSADRVFLPFSFGPFIGFWAAVEGIRRIGALMIPGGGRDSRQRLQMMADLGATALCCTPTYALRLTEAARENGIDLRNLPVRTSIHAGEPGASIESTRRRIEAAWQARCFDHAGASEVGAYSFECEAHSGGIHVIESEFVVEVRDLLSGRPLPPGHTGELVVTNLGRMGFPVLRYRTGDLVRLDRDPCPCGRTFVRLEGGLLGRADDMVVIRGINVYPRALENIILRAPAVEEFRITATFSGERAELGVEVELAGGGDPETVRALLEREIHDELALRPRIVAVEKGTLPRHELKSRRFHVVRLPDGS